MFLAVPIDPKDIKDAFYLLLHLAIDSDLIKYFQITEKELEEHFQQKLFQCFVICSSNALYHRPAACLLFCEDYSLKYGNGLYVDAFCVIEGLRYQGFGRLLMCRLCEEVRLRQYNYIKLHFRNRKSLGLMYNKMGFCNETIHDKKIQIFEVYGKRNMDTFLSKKYFPTKCVLYNEIIASPIASTIYKANVVMVNVFQADTNKMAGFLEQIVYCGWLGPVLVFKDFVGSTEIIELNMFKERFKDRQEKGSQCLAMWWEVPESYEALKNDLELNGVDNVSKTEGWQIGCLYREGSRDFSYFSKTYHPKRSVKCGTLNRFDVIHKNIYFC